MFFGRSGHLTGTARIFVLARLIPGGVDRVDDQNRQDQRQRLVDRCKELAGQAGIQNGVIGTALR